MKGMPVAMTLSRRAMDAYSALLPRHQESTVAGVRATWSDLHIQGKPICRSLQPLFIGRAFHDRATRHARLVTRAFEIAVAHTPRQGLSARVTELLRLALARPSVTMVRLDGFPHGDTLAFLESNAIGQVVMPAGIGEGDLLRAAFRALPILRDLGERIAVRDVSTTELAVDSVLAAHRARGGGPAPSIVVIDVGNVPLPPAPGARDQRLLLEAAMRRGCAVRLGFLRDARFAGGQLWLGDLRVDVLYVGDVTGRYFEVCPDDSPILAAVRAGAVTLGDGFPLNDLAHGKGVLDVLTDPEASVPLDEEMAAAVAACLPWTRVCRDRRTTFRGEPVDLRAFVVGNRKRLVLKPAGGYGGAGVVLGWCVDADTWAAAVAAAFEGATEHVVQERVAGARVPLPFLDDDGAVRVREVRYDLNPYVWIGACDGWWSRVSSSDLLNVTAGPGSEVPVFVVEDTEG